MPSNAPDDILIEQILKGNRASFKLLVERYQNLVFTIAYRITNNREEAEEVAQDSFLKVYNNLQGFAGQAKFSSWLYRIAHNTALTKIRNRKAPYKEIENAGNLPVANEAEQAFARADLDKAISQLDPDEATIITLFYLAELNMEEIAATLNIEPNAAKVRLFRARKKLREQMELLS